LLIWFGSGLKYFKSSSSSWKRWRSYSRGTSCALRVFLLI
jgi:hypothetical protein